MKLLYLILAILILTSCDSPIIYKNYRERDGVDRIKFQKDKGECLKEGNLQATRSEGSKRAGEILIDKGRYSMNCMKRKGWVLRDDL